MAETPLIYEISDGNGGTDVATVTFTIAEDSFFEVPDAEPIFDMG